MKSDTDIQTMDDSQLLRSFDRSGELRQRWLLFGAIVVVAGVVLAAWMALASIERYTRRNAVAALDSVLASTHHSIREIWAKVRFADARAWASEPEILAAARALTKMSGANRESLAAHPELARLRAFFGTRGQRHEFRGMFVIGPDGRSLASMRDSNLGSTNLIAERFPNLLKSVFAGKTRMTPPTKSDVPLPDRDGKPRPEYPTMFVLAPIRDGKDEVLAVLAIRIDPFAEFFPIAAQGRIGESGETYLVNQEGVLLTPSRFTGGLVAMGLLEPGRDASLNVDVRNPGIDLRNEPHHPHPHRGRPLTVMATGVAAGSRGRAPEGIRDYRGVRVLSAWLWDEHLGMGFATEIDEEEALSPYYHSRRMMIVLVSGVLLLVSGVAGVSVMADRRSSGEARKRAALLTAIGRARDSERKIRQARDEAEAANRAKSEFLSRMSHELRSPNP